MKFIIVESGSKGNATLLIHGSHILLIDMGVSLSSLRSALNSINKNLMNIDALLLTHSHCDHTRGVRYLDPLPIYCTEGTYKNGDINIINAYETFVINDIKITPLEASHDADNTIGFLFEVDKEKLVYLTDTGMIPEKSLSLMKNADYYIIESNHNVKKLHQSHRPIELKLKILSDNGHLSNEDSAIYMSELVGAKTKQIVLAHLSEECNTPELAVKAYQKVFSKCHISLDKIELKCASQHEALVGGNKNEL